MERAVELKLMGLNQRIAELTAEWENKVMDLRVNLTITTEDLQAAQQEIARLNERVQELEAEAVTGENTTPPGEAD
jgi:hypothetical protein